MLSSQPDIFVVGFPRSGTSWIGNTLSLVDGVTYVPEPLRRAYDDGVPGISPWKVCFRNRRSPAEERILSGNCGERRVVKLVHACFKAERFHEVFKPTIVLVSRGPYGQISSWLRDNTFSRFPPKFILRTVIKYKRLRNRLPETCHRAVSFLQGNRLEAMSALWVLINKLLQYYHKENGWVFVSYEKVCRDPLGEFTRLYGLCELPMIPAWVEATVKKRTASMPTIWKERLSREQIKVIGRTTKRILYG